VTLRKYLVKERVKLVPQMRQPHELVTNGKPSRRSRLYDGKLGVLGLGPTPGSYQDDGPRERAALPTKRALVP
jgi:hypothetical protein